MDLGLNGKVAMVAAASRGLGFAVAQALATEGVAVSIASRDAAAIQMAKSSIETNWRFRVHACTADVRSPEAIAEWRDQTIKQFGGVDLLFVNAGGPPAGRFLDFDDRAWQDAIDLLLLSAVRLVRAVIPSMKERGGGSVVFSTSSSVKEPIDNLVLSNVVRAGLPALAKTLSREFASEKIRFNSIIPGRYDTARIRELDLLNAQRKNITTDEQQKTNIAAIPLGRYGIPDEYARAAVFLLSPAASYITGATLQVDGGLIRSVL